MTEHSPQEEMTISALKPTAKVARNGPFKGQEIIDLEAIGRHILLSEFLDRFLPKGGWSREFIDANSIDGKCCSIDAVEPDTESVKPIIAYFDSIGHLVDIALRYRRGPELHGTPSYDVRGVNGLQIDPARMTDVLEAYRRTI